MADTANPFTLSEWRREIAELYGRIRARPPEQWDEARREFRSVRDRLFASHPQSPLQGDERDGFEGLPYYDYDPDYRVRGALDRDVEAETFTVELRDDGTFRYSRVARARFELDGDEHALPVYWVEGYGGGLFLPFSDATNGDGTYGGGRYLYDAIKGADLGAGTETLPLDFNFAYNPSCAYSDRWHCPLAPPETRLAVPIEAGERADATDADSRAGTATPARE